MSHGFGCLKVGFECVFLRGCPEIVFLLFGFSLTPQKMVPKKKKNIEDT